MVNIHFIATLPVHEHGYIDGEWVQPMMIHDDNDDDNHIDQWQKQHSQLRDNNNKLRWDTTNGSSKEEFWSRIEFTRDPDFSCRNSRIKVSKLFTITERRGREIVSWEGHKKKQLTKDQKVIIKILQTMFVCLLLEWCRIRHSSKICILCVYALFYAFIHSSASSWRVAGANHRCVVTPLPGYMRSSSSSSSFSWCQYLDGECQWEMAAMTLTTMTITLMMTIPL